MNDLERFVDAQAAVYSDVLAELTVGQKRSHWMWFVFPQLAVLGRSAIAKFYGLRDLEEAMAYWAHPLLGARLRECVERVLTHEAKSTHQIFGSPDDLKFCSCLTLFEKAADERCFGAAIDRFYAGRRDSATLAQIDRAGP